MGQALSVAPKGREPLLGYAHAIETKVRTKPSNELRDLMWELKDAEAFRKGVSPRQAKAKRAKVAQEAGA